MGRRSAQMVLFGVVLVAITASALSPELRKQLNLQGISTMITDSDSNMIYFADNILRDHSSSQTFCNTEHELADLAIISGSRFYTILRFGTFPPAGTYWINGRENPEGRKFDILSNCTASSNIANLDEINNEIRSPGNNDHCLALIKGNSPSTTYLQLQPCTTKNRVLCSLLLSGDCGNSESTTEPSTSTLAP